MFNKTVIINYPFFKVVADGGILLSEVGDGRNIPCVMIDVVDNVEVSELLRLHDTTPPGDIELQWSLPTTLFSIPKSVFLNITFLRPMKITFGIDFSISERFSIIDGILQSRSFYLQVGKAGDKVSTLFIDKTKQKTHGCILIEVPNMGFDKKWNEILLSFLKQKYSKKGAKRKEAIISSKEQIKKMRELWNKRIPIG